MCIRDSDETVRYNLANNDKPMSFCFDNLGSILTDGNPYHDREAYDNGVPYTAKTWRQCNYNTIESMNGRLDESAA